MANHGRLLSALAVTVALGLAACGGGSSSSSSDTGSSSSGSGGGSSSGGGGGKNGGTITMLYGTAPDSLDPGFGYTTQAAENDWIAYTGLLTYAHQSGTAGGQLIPGLATALPQISSDGKTYTLTLRKGLKYSNGKPVKASDFPYTLQRSMKISWGGKSFFTSYIKGAEEFDSGKAKTISGIKTDDATGKITITLVKPYGAFANVLAFPSAGLVPTGSVMKNSPNNPPPGVGPYEIVNVKPNQGWQLKKVKQFASFKIPGIPAGHVDLVNAKINSNTNAEGQQVLSNQADVFDYGDTLPPAMLGQIKAQASDRFSKETIPSTFYFFLNVKEKPFNNKFARQAVNYAIDKKAMVKLASGFLKPTCFFLPEGIAGHPSSQCPYQGADGGPDIAKAKALVKKSGMAGTKVTVWGETRQPRQQYVTYYASVLNKIGFKATPKILADATYFTTIGNAHSKAQTGFADWIQDFPNPSDFYLLLSCEAIQPVNNENFSNICDKPGIQDKLDKLNPVPATKLDSVATQWQSLDEYTAKQAYVAVYGSELVPKFFSNKLNFGSAIFHPTYGNDITSLQLK